MAVNGSYMIFKPSWGAELEAALWWRLGEAYRSRDLRYAVFWYKKARQRLPDEMALRSAYEDALQAQDTLPMTPRAVGDYLHLGRERIVHNDPQRAIDYFNDALELDEESVQAYIERGSAFLSIKEFRRAITDFEQALRLDRRNVVTLRKRGEAYELLSDLPRAVEDFSEALRLDPDNELIFPERCRRDTSRLHLSSLFLFSLNYCPGLINESILC